MCQIGVEVCLLALSIFFTFHSLIDQKLIFMISESCHIKNKRIATCRHAQELSGTSVWHRGRRMIEAAIFPADLDQHTSHITSRDFHFSAFSICQIVQW
jgi:hypothetical protein